VLDDAVVLEPEDVHGSLPTAAVVIGLVPDITRMHGDQVARLWLKTQPLVELAALQWEYPDDPQEIGIGRTDLAAEARWTLARDWNGRGKEFMPPLDEGSFLLMPTPMPHASIGETLDVLQKQDRAIRAIPEIDTVVGKVGRAETSLDPADMEEAVAPGARLVVINHASNVTGTLLPVAEVA
jgi:hypothetical protein